MGKDKLPSGTSLTSDTVTATSPETTDDDDDDDEDAAEEQPAGKTVTQSLTFQDVDGKSQDVADAVKDALAAQDAALPTSTSSPSSSAFVLSSSCQGDEMMAWRGYPLSPKCLACIDGMGAGHRHLTLNDLA